MYLLILINTRLSSTPNSSAWHHMIIPDTHNHMKKDPNLAVDQEGCSYSFQRCYI